jgi:hypothetical protein
MSNNIELMNPIKELKSDSSISNKSKLLFSEIKSFKETDRNNKKMLLAKKNSIIELLDNSDELSNSLIESDYVFVDCLENKKVQLIELEKELMEIREIFADMVEIVNMQQNDINIIDDNITRTQDNIVDAEIELLMAKQSDDSRKKLYALPIIIGAVIIGLVKIL